MNISGSMPVDDGGVSLRIVRILKHFQKPVHIDLLARELGYRPENLMGDLNSLAEKGTVTIDRVNETVVLTGNKSSSLSTFFHWLSGTS